jgi:4'-phosphopantetheinyl transferase
MPLPAGRAQIWLVNSDALRDPALLGRYEALLDRQDRERLQRYIPDRAKHLHLVSRALLRTGLSRHAEVQPQSWRFAAGEHGRPEIAAPAGHDELRFNLSHTDGLVALAVVRRLDVGVDVEHVHRRRETVGIADRFFAAAEVAELRSLPAEQQQSRFFDYWTLKESYIKARGMGLAIPLGKFAFSLAPGAAPAIAFDDALGDDPRQWQFGLFSPTPDHRLALGLRRGAGAVDLEIEIDWCVPLGD